MEKLTKEYNLSYFLASLGNGGLAVTVFTYLMFMVKHADAPMPTFNHIYDAFIIGDFVTKVLLIGALTGIMYFAYKHFAVLAWNLKEFKEFKTTRTFNKMKDSNEEINIMTIPLTLAMSVNVIFIIGAVFIPGLWDYVEYLFPFSIIAFMIIGIYALKIFYGYLSRLIHNGDFDFTKNNNLGQLVSSFAFQMVGVGLAAAGAMSHNVVTSSIGIIGAIFFTTIAWVLLINNFVLGLKSIFRYGIMEESSPSLWMVIPVTTLLGITIVRITAGVYHNLLHIDTPNVFIFIVLTLLISLQIIIGLIGYTVMNRNGYFKRYVHGNGNSVGSYALICPGVAAFVLGMFFIHWGMVKTHIVVKNSIIYFMLLIPLVIIQFKTIFVLNKVNKKLFLR